MSISATICGVGHAVPAKVVTNFDLEKILDTSDAWIAQRTGIRERRVCEPHETTSMLASEAARNALEPAGITAADIDLIVLATISGDYIWPSTASVVQDMIGAKNAGAFDVSAACAGFVYALANTSAMIRAGEIQNALVIGADTLSRQVDWSDRGTAILFGDAAGAVVLRAKEDEVRGVIASVLYSDGSGAKSLLIEGGGTKAPFGSEGLTPRDLKIKMAGSEVYRFAVQAMGDACERVLEKAGMHSSDVDLFVPHQANIRIINSAADRLGLPSEKVFVNVDRFGNTSGGSVPLALSEASAQGRLKEGMIVMTVGFGGGLVWGANLIRW